MGEMTATDFEGFPPLLAEKRIAAATAVVHLKSCHVSVHVFRLTSVKAIFNFFGWRESFEGKEKNEDGYMGIVCGLHEEVNDQL